MITPVAVTNHLKLYLSRFTDLFTKYIVVNSASVGAGNVVSVNATGHGITTGQKKYISKGTVRNSLSASLLNNGTVVFTCNFEHDLVVPKYFNDDKILNLNGFINTAWNGEHEIIGVPNRTEFIINLPSGETVAPDVTGAYLIENRNLGFVGLYEITVVDDDNFTYIADNSPSLPVGIIDGIELVDGFRITSVSDFQRARAAYTKFGNNELWMFVIMDTVDSSKDRNSNTDALLDATNQSFNLLRLIQNFSTWVFFPTKNDQFGSEAQQLAYSEVFISLNKTLYNFGLNNQDSVVPYNIVNAGHSPGAYNTAFYMHIYDWQQADAISFENSGLQDLDSVAFRDIESTWDLNDDDLTQLELNINLDEDANEN